MIYPCRTPCLLSPSFLVLLQRWCHHLVCRKLVVLRCTAFSMLNSSLRYSSYFTENTVDAQLFLRPQFIRHGEHDKNSTQGNLHGCTVHVDNIKSFTFPTNAHTNYSKIFELLKILKLQYLLQHVSVYINHHQGAQSLCFAKVTILISFYTCR